MNFNAMKLFEAKGIGLAYFLLAPAFALLALNLLGVRFTFLVVALSYIVFAFFFTKNLMRECKP